MIGLLWHLHQPEYRDPETGRPVMPWTRLHALRGYRDLLVESIESGVPWTMNIVPGLWDQVLYYARGGDDRHLELTRRAADSLDDAEREELRETFPCGNPAMRRTPRYRELEDAIRAGRALSTIEIRDLQVLSTLVWTGATARRDHEVFRALVAKGRDFTEADKAALLAAQDAVLAELPDLLRRFVATDGPALATSPLHHPILPLLVDVRHAGRSTARAPDLDFAWPDDARRQLRLGRDRMATWAGVRPRGCWPSEGSVSPEVVALVAEAGFDWLATDDGVLARSERTRTREGGGGWDLGHGVIGFFRDHRLSDRLGFDYAHLPVPAAVEDFFGRAGEGLTVVALDGENPWEAFPDAGAALRERLIERLCARDGRGRRGITLDDATHLEPVGRVVGLHSGSWIAADFSIWAGAEEDHRAWEALASARSAVEVAEEGREAALEHLMAAEGSDWFWWYGPEFDTPFADVFDRAFRAHLRAAWEAIGEVPPLELDQPIEPPRARIREPDRPIVPEGLWLGAGEWVLPQGVMARGGGRRVRFGWDLAGTLWLRLPAGIRSLEIDGVARSPEPVVSVPGGRSAVVAIDGAQAQLAGPDWVV